MATVAELKQAHRDSEITVLAGVKVWIGAQDSIVADATAEHLRAAFVAYEKARDDYEAAIDAELQRIKRENNPLTLVPDGAP